MPRDGVTLDPTVIAAVAWAAAGEQVNVTALCRAQGISRKSFYKYLARYREEGPAGFITRATTPGSSPSRTSELVEERIVRARKELADQGWDHGATSVRWRLIDQGLDSVPSVSTVHRVLSRRGQITPAPHKRPRTTYQRFERDRPNDLWQMDGFEVKLADRHTAVVIQLIDDHSRLDLVCHAAPAETGDAAWVAVTTAMAQYGLPRQLLTDNSTAFNAERRGWVTQLCVALRQIGVEPITCHPHHPQTCGKNERAHQTVRRWLAKQDPPVDLAHLQQLLDRYRYSYNNDRRHQALDGFTPWQRWQRTAPATPDEGQIDAPELPLRMARYVISDTGVIVVAQRSIALSRTLAGHLAVTFRRGNELSIFVDAELLGTHTLDTTRRYQRLSNPVSPQS